MIKTLFRIIIVFILIIIGFYWYKHIHPVSTSTKSATSSTYPQAMLTLDGVTYTVDIANTPILLQVGLSGRTTLATTSGMLFVFPKSNYYSFWMKDMNFPIDIIWLNENKQIVYIKDSVLPSTYPTSFVSSSTALYVIELVGGQAQKTGMKIGDLAEIVEK